MDHANHERKKEWKKITKTSKVQLNLPRKDSLGSRDRETWPAFVGRCPLFRDQNKSECIRRNKQKNPITEVRISSSKTLTRMITVNLFQPEIFSKADSEMW